MKKYIALLLILSALVAFGLPTLLTKPQFLKPQFLKQQFAVGRSEEYAMFCVTLGAGTDIAALALQSIAPFADERTKSLLESASQEKKQPQPEQPQRIRLACAGDLMCHDLCLEAAFEPQTQSYDFRPFFARIKPYVSSADIAVANLETTLGGPSIKFQGYPRFSSPDAYLEAALDTGFNVLTNANNHSLDHGAAALSRTLRKLSAAKIPHTGASASQERSKPVIVEAKDVKFGFAAYTYGSNRRDNAASLNQLYVKNKLNTEDIALDIAQLKRDGADVIILSVHWGAEYTEKPSARMRSEAAALAELGADVILGHHPHSLQPVSMLTRANKTIPVVYSMGNFFCNPSKERCTAEGVLVFLSFEKRGGKAEFVGLEYIPTYISRTRGVKTTYDILPLVGAQPESFLETIRKRIIARVGSSAMIKPLMAQ